MLLFIKSSDAHSWWMISLGFTILCYEHIVSGFLSVEILCELGSGYILTSKSYFAFVSSRYTRDYH